MATLDCKGISLKRRYRPEHVKAMSKQLTNILSKRQRIEDLIPKVNAFLRELDELRSALKKEEKEEKHKLIAKTWNEEPRAPFPLNPREAYTCYQNEVIICVELNVQWKQREAEGECSCVEHMPDIYEVFGAELDGYDDTQHRQNFSTKASNIFCNVVEHLLKAKKHAVVKVAKEHASSDSLQVPCDYFQCEPYEVDCSGDRDDPMWHVGRSRLILPIVVRFQKEDGFCWMQ